MAERASEEQAQPNVLDAVLGAKKQPEPETEPDTEISSDESQETGDQEEVELPEVGESEEAEAEAEATDDEPDDEDESDEPADEGGDDGVEYIDIRDDDVIPVMVDGEEREATIGELKKALSGEGAIEKRLQEATEMRKAAIAERTHWMENQAAQERMLHEVFDGLDDSVFKGVIPPPPAELRQSDPQRYLRHQEAYEQDQKRIKEAKEKFEGRRKEVEQARQQRLAQYAQQAAQIIQQEIPELANPDTADKTFKSMAETAMQYGYSADEINNALDPRMFMLVRDAMRYRQMTEKTATRNPKDLEQQQTKKVRRLRSGNTQAKSRARQSDQKRKAAVKRARETGKPNDVAATLLMPKG